MSGRGVDDHHPETRCRCSCCCALFHGGGRSAWPRNDGEASRNCRMVQSIWQIAHKNRSLRWPRQRNQTSSGACSAPPQDQNTVARKQQTDQGIKRDGTPPETRGRTSLRWRGSSRRTPLALSAPCQYGVPGFSTPLLLIPGSLVHPTTLLMSQTPPGVRPSGYMLAWSGPGRFSFVLKSHGSKGLRQGIVDGMPSAGAGCRHVRRLPIWSAVADAPACYHQSCRRSTFAHPPPNARPPQGSANHPFHPPFCPTTYPFAHVRPSNVRRVTQARIHPESASSSGCAALALVADGQQQRSHANCPSTLSFKSP